MRPTEMIVDLSIIRQNARVIRGAIPERVKMLGVVKADAYGHGAAEVSQVLLEEGAFMLAVATGEEALELRQAGIACPILILGATPGDMLEEMILRGVSMAVYDADTLQALGRAAERAGRPALAHLKYDTGMSRIGVRGEGALTELIRAWKRQNGVRMEGFFTHFCAAESDPAFTQAQNEAFFRGVTLAREAGFQPIAHAAASSAMLRRACQHDMVRAGIALYGSCAPDLPVACAQTLRTKPVRIQRVSAGDTVGYGRTYAFDRDSLVMTLPIGYGDGYPRALSNRADVLVRGMRAPIVGNVCMDMLMADVTSIPGVSLEDEVVLMGAQGGERITPDELARLAGTISYEIMLGFLPRVKRIHQKG